MFGNFLVPLDGSSMANRILPHVAAIARINGPPETITLLRVLETDGIGSTAVDPVSWRFARAEAQAHLDEAAKQLAQLGLISNTVLLAGDAAQRIVEYAHKHNTDLLVLSSHGLGGESDWNVSSVAQKVIQRAGSSILLARSVAKSGEEHETVDIESVRYQRILAPLDGSPRAESALNFVCALAERYAAELLVAHVAAHPEMIQPVGLSSEDASLAERVLARNIIESKKYFTHLQSRLPSTAQTRVLIDDSVARALHGLVEQEQVDMVVLSAHGDSCDSQWPYSALVNSFITYGVTSLIILQDLPAHNIRRAGVVHAEEAVPMPIRSLYGEEGLSARTHVAN